MFLVDLEAHKPMLKVGIVQTYHLKEVLYTHGSCHLFSLGLGFSFALDVAFPVLRAHVFKVLVGTGIIVLSVLCYLSCSFPFVASYRIARSRNLGGSVSGTFVRRHGLGTVAVTSYSGMSSGF